MEFFIEGTRSRTNKTMPPKYGFMSVCTKVFF
jgi:glycerol-3-phosphate O-acyltransferase